MNVDTIVAEKAEVSTMIHCGSQAVTLYDVAAAPLPESTGTFVPVPHFDVLCELTDQVHERGWEFYEPNTEKQYKIWLSKNGLRMAAYTIVQIPGLHHKDGQSAIGITNGNDRGFALSGAAGGYVWICDNTALAGAIKVREIHSRKLNLRELISGLLDPIPAYTERMYNWWDRMQDAKCDADHGIALLAKAVETKALPIAGFMSARGEWLKAYDNANPKIAYGGTAWALHQAVTGEYRELGINRNHDYALQLDRLMHAEFGK